MKKIYGNFEAEEGLDGKYLVVVCEDGELEISECETLEEAKEEMEFILGERMASETEAWDFADSDGKISLLPTAEEVEVWNQMIDEYKVYTVENGKSDHAWILSDKELKTIGWVKK